MNQSEDYFMKLLRLEQEVKTLTINYWNLKRDCEYSHQRLIELEKTVIKEDEEEV